MKAIEKIFALILISAMVLLALNFSGQTKNVKTEDISGEGVTIKYSPEITDKFVSKDMNSEISLRGGSGGRGSVGRSAGRGSVGKGTSGSKSAPKANPSKEGGATTKSAAKESASVGTAEKNLFASSKPMTYSGSKPSPVLPVREKIPDAGSFYNEGANRLHPYANSYGGGGNSFPNFWFYMWAFSGNNHHAQTNQNNNTSSK